MVSQLTFDAAAGDRAKTEGMKRAADSKTSFVAVARAVALILAKTTRPTLTIDDVYEELFNRKFTDITAELGKAAGHVFTKEYFEFTGEWRKSKRVSNHNRMVRVWRLRKP